MGIEHLHVQNRVDRYLDVVPRDADLLGNVDRLLFQAVAVGNALDEGDQNVESGLKRPAVSAEAFDHVRALLRHHGRGFRDHDDDDHSNDDEGV